jgi:cephalosporin hydroxylase
LSTSEKFEATQNSFVVFQREVRRNIAALAGAHDLQNTSMRWLRESLGYRYSYNFSSLGRPIIQYPQDMVAVNELIWKIRPDVIIETGVAHGGSLIQSAAALALLDYCDAVEGNVPLDTKKSRRRVIGIDIDIRPQNHKALQAHPLAHKLDLVVGSSIDPAVVASVRKRVAPSEKVMVLLDSNHTHAHVHAELESYAPLVSLESYCVVFDTVIELLPPDQYPDREWAPGNSPLSAVKQYLSTLSRDRVNACDGARLSFQMDSELNSKLMISVAPDGYLRRVSAM